MKIFIINLERSKDRRQVMQERIDILFTKYPSLKDKLEFIFFQAVDGGGDKQELEKFEKHFTPLAKIYAGGEGMSSPEKACFASHYLLWKKCLELDEKIIILEDDVEFADEIVEHIDKIAAMTYECVRFNYKKGKIAYYIEENIGLVLKNNSFGAFAYFLNPKGAQKLLAKAKKWYFPVDYHLDIFYYHGVWHLMYDIAIFKATSAKTTIHNAKLKLYEKIMRKITRLFVKFFSHCYKSLYLLFHNPKKVFPQFKKDLKTF
ncbi:glycosyltransferase family 25 protein [Campylobacter sp. VTCC 70190]|uniref:glycosyltransferase family 25 protein n=1 Tax=Campylobacter sp. VTCC 70190 TaxID=3392118 RepID=UPI00398EA7B8